MSCTLAHSGASPPRQDQQLDRAAVQDHPRLLHGEHQIWPGHGGAGAGRPRALAPVSGSGRVGARSMFSHLFLRFFRGKQGPKGACAVTASQVSCIFILILPAFSCRVKVEFCPKPAITSRSFGRATTGCLRSCRGLTSFSWTTMCFGSR